MGAARLVMTMGMMAIGAGAVLALSTTSALAPYQILKPAGRLSPIAPPLHDSEMAPDADYGFVSPPRREDDEYEPSEQNGADLLQLPRWAEDSGEWIALGRRAWHDWVEPGDDFAADEPDDRAYAPRRRRQREWDDGPYGYAQDHDLRRDWREDEGYEAPDRWRTPEPMPMAPYPEPPQPYTRAQPVPRDLSDRAMPDVSQAQDDAAAKAAERARQAARDVRAAEGL